MSTPQQTTPNAPQANSDHKVQPKETTQVIIVSSCKAKSQRPRRNAPSKHHIQHSADVTKDEIQMMKLSAITCHEVNARAADPVTTFRGSPSNSRKKNKTSNVNNAFFIKTAARKDYGSSLTFGPQILPTPTTMCPDIDGHVERVYDLKMVLPLACPTCWSLQRN